jgi:GNAT superfamily N-acetyltransferase
VQFTLRGFRDDDTDRVVSLWYQTHHRAFEQLREDFPLYRFYDLFFSLDLNDCNFLIVTQGESVCGFAYSISGDLRHLYVAHEYWRQGIGTLLLDRTMALSPDGLRLRTLESNLGGRKFYRSRGFQQISVECDEILGVPFAVFHWPGVNVTTAIKSVYGPTPPQGKSHCLKK